MDAPESKRLNLESLENIPVIDSDAVPFFCHNCIVCFDNRNHRSGVNLQVIYKERNHWYEICWEGEATEQLRRCYADLRRATDQAACAIALLLTREMTDYTGYRQSIVGTTVDYYLIPKDEDSDSDLIFNDAACLEVSGILTETPENSVDRRIKEKLERLKEEDGMPTFIVVVEFSKPWSKMVEAR